MTEAAFEPWPKIARLNRNITITEKIDGTNAAVLIVESSLGDFDVYAQSRTRIITPEDDNFGFANWVSKNVGALVATLGPGRHFGEWWGSGIQRKYGLVGDDKRFSLFNTARYGAVDFAAEGLSNVSTVPVLYEGLFSESVIKSELRGLEAFGSEAAPGFLNPEGVVVFHQAAREMFKVTIQGDEAPKSQAS